MTNKPKNVVCLDVGQRRIGVAASDALGITAQGLETYVRKGFKQDLEHIAAIAGQRKAEAFVVGLPLNMDGTKGFQAQETEAFGNALFERTGILVIYEDERLTTRQARSTLHAGGISGKNQKKMVDKVAAVLILQNYLEGT